MGQQNEPTFWQEIMQGAGKFITWFAYISIGVLAKLAFDSRNAKLTKKNIIVKTVLSIFCGFIAAQVCENFGYDSYIGIISPVATLLGESIIVYVMTNWKAVTFKFFPNLNPDNKPKS